MSLYNITQYCVLYFYKLKILCITISSIWLFPFSLAVNC